MKKFVIFTLILSSNIFALPNTIKQHLDLEMTTREYQIYLESNQKLYAEPDDKPIAEALALGNRLSKWISYENTHRDPAQAIRLTSANTRRGIPIETPNVYSEKTVEADLAKFLKEAPKEIIDVVNSDVMFPPSLPVSDEIFILWGRKLDRIYQTAARYKGAKLYLEYYISAAKDDVRGYYFFTKNKITSDMITPTSKIADEMLPTILQSLKFLCLNSNGSQRSCDQTIQSAKEKDGLGALLDSWMPRGKQLWNSFFVIPNSAKRRDVTVTSDSLTVPFHKPALDKFYYYLKNNIEDEFRYANWGLKLNFGNFPMGPHLVFQSGVVPHVNGLGGNEIVMDSNQPIEEYESQWTIRHEFGHVLGLPDCYHEFYDVNLKAFVNYQLDTTDLMCSRAGNMKERIYLQLKSTYGING